MRHAGVHALHDAKRLDMSKGVTMQSAMVGGGGRSGEGESGGEQGNGGDAGGREGGGGTGGGKGGAGGG